MKKTLLVIFVLSLLFPAFLSAQENERLRQVQEKFNSASTITADISQSGGNNSLNGTIYLKKDNKLRLELPNNTIISDGSTIWNYSKKENKVIINEFNENDPSSFSFDKILNEYPNKSKVTMTEEGGNNILILTPDKSSDLNFDRVKLWINDENLVEKVRLEKSGNPTEIKISNYRLDQGIPDSRFTFMPPEGSQVIDLR